jgi:cell division septation protein DedD
MFSIEEIICQLLLRHSCVIIPSFGGFVAQAIPASIDLSKGTIIPPSKHLLFNKNLINNDGLLTAEFASVNKLSFDDSFLKIADFASELKSEINRGIKVEIAKIGTFHLDEEKNICFEQNRYFNFLLSSYGLSNVQFVPSVKDVVIAPKVDEVKVIEQAPIIEIETPIVEIKAKKSNRIVKYAAIAACFLPIAFYSVWIPMKTNVIQSGVITLNDFNPFHKKDANLFVPSKTTLSLIHKTEIVKEINTNTTTNDLHTDNSPTEEVVNQTLEVVSNNNSSSGKRQSFEYIVGCFSSDNNAVQLVATLKSQGFDAAIIEGGNLTRVSIGSASSQKMLDSLIQLSISKGYQGWILK